MFNQVKPSYILTKTTTIYYDTDHDTVLCIVLSCDMVLCIMVYRNMVLCIVILAIWSSVTWCIAIQKVWQYQTLLYMRWHGLCVSGKPVLGDVGELVCTKPFPSMPTRFWNDDSGIKYKKAYFNQWPGENPTITPVCMGFYS